MNPDYWNTLLKYEPDTGLLFWKINRGTRNLCGKMAGSLSHNGYIQIGHKKKSYYAHRIIWMIYHEKDPGDFLIDHIDRNRTNNKINNLRLVTFTGNSINAAERHPNRVTGHKGIHRTKHDTYYAQISINGRNKHLGTFPSLNLALEARKMAERIYHVIPELS